MGGKPARKKEREKDKLPRNTNKRMTAKEDKKKKKIISISALVGADTMERQTIKTVDATPDDGDGKNAMGRRS